MKTRRHFLHQSLAAATGTFIVPGLAQQLRPEGENISFGVSTRIWGADWDIPTIITSLKQLGINGVELHADHAHKVTAALSPEQRKQVQQEFAEGGIEIVGMSTSTAFNSADKATLLTNLDVAKQYIKLSHDIGGSGVTVEFGTHPEQDRALKAKNLEQIAKSLAELGDFAIGFGQEIRLEVPSDKSSHTDVLQIMQTAAADNVRVCWNSNQADITEDSIEKNFGLMKDLLGQTIHVRPLQDASYPFANLIKLLVYADYTGWVLLEAETEVEDRIKALGEQKALFEKLVAEARKA